MEAATRRALLLLLLVASSVPAGLCQTNAQDGQSTSMIIIIRKLCFSLSIIFCWSSFLTHLLRVDFCCCGSFGDPVADERVDQLPVDVVVVRRPLQRQLGRDHVQQREDHIAVSTHKQFPSTTAIIPRFHHSFVTITSKYHHHPHENRLWFLQEAVQRQPAGHAERQHRTTNPALLSVSPHAAWPHLASPAMVSLAATVHGT
jgi:hypothetical protein